jgi:hypothetical protein
LPDSTRLWQETTNRLAREASQRVSATYIRYAQGVLSLEEAIGIQAALIAAAQRRAVTFNDLLLAAELTQRLEGEYNAVGISWMETPEVQAARLAKAISTVVGDDIAYVNKGRTPEQVRQLAARSIRARLDRLTVAEVTSASQWSRQTALTAWEGQGAIAGWYRRLSPNACDFCRTLAGAGDPARYIHAVQSRMPTHAHCSCSQGWVTEVEPWQKFIGPKQQMRLLQTPDAGGNK